MADLGNISNLLTSSVPDLEWLDVDAEQYRARDTLPKQNLEIIPDLEAAWTHEDKPASTYVPNRGEAPRTMGDLSKEHGLLRASPADIRKTARMALMLSDDPHRFRHMLASRFDKESLQENRAVLAAVLSERGLLGKVYVDSADFPNCNRGSDKTQAFVKRYAAGAQYVLQKPSCQGCVHAHATPAGGEACSVFHKELKVQVPYTQALADEIEQKQQAAGKHIQATSDQPRERIRLAMLAPNITQHQGLLPRGQENVQRLLAPVVAVENYEKPINLAPLQERLRKLIGSAFQEGRMTLAQTQTAYRFAADAASVEDLNQLHQKVMGVDMPEIAVYVGAGQQRVAAPMSASEATQTLIAASSLTRKRDEDAQRMLVAKKAQPVISLLRREMLKGRSERELVSTLKHAFTTPDLQATRTEWAPLLKEAGLFGVIYSTQEAFDECHVGADFLAKHNPGVKVMVAGQKCADCFYNKLNRCMIYGKPLVASAAEVSTTEMVEQVLADHKAAGRIAAWDTRMAWGASPREALKNIHTAASYQGGASVGQARDSIVRAFHGTAPAHSLRTDTRRSIVAATRQHLNEGLYGRDLVRALRARFEPRDLEAAEEDLRPLVAEQGLQGIYFVDPIAYSDYGRGCDEAARLHRSRSVPYVKMGDKCGSCVLQTEAGHCSKLNKPLVANVPYPGDREEIQREMLASGDSTTVDLAKLVNNGRDMMAQFEIQERGLQIDLDPVLGPTPVKVTFR